MILPIKWCRRSPILRIIYAPVVLFDYEGFEKILVWRTVAIEIENEVEQWRCGDDSRLRCKFSNSILGLALLATILVFRALHF